MGRRITILSLLAAWAPGLLGAQDKAPLDLLQTIPMPGCHGKIDHLAVDVAGKRLFVATTANNSVQVIDLAQGKLIHKIEGLKDFPADQRPPVALPFFGFRIMVGSA